MALEPWIGRHHPVAHKLRELMDPVVRRHGLELVDIQFRESRHNGAVQVYADAPGGISLQQLEMLSRTLGDLLDAEDPIPGDRYELEVSSPGVDRPLTTAAHFEAAHGAEVAIVSIEKVDGSRKHRGVLSGFGPQGAVLQVDGVSRTIALESIDSANTIYQFGPPAQGKKPGHKHQNQNQDRSRGNKQHPGAQQEE
jgi:ribosome maturation factor RimP